MERSKGFLFFNGFDYEDILSDQAALIRRLVSFAAEFGLEGNIWQQWLSYTLMTDENDFTLACERREVLEDCTLMELAASDMAGIRELMHKEPVPLMSSYRQPCRANSVTAQGRRIAGLTGRLDAAGSDRAFLKELCSEYERYGIGIYGLYRAFRVSEYAASSDDVIRLVPVGGSADVCFDDLVGYESQKETLRANTEAFVRGEQANNVLLYGDSGTGKSTSVHALMHEFFDRGLRLVEISKQQRRLLPQVMAEVKKRNYRFIIFLDDLSFEENESDYKELKAMLEGALESGEDRVLIYATSNRRHLIRETWKDRSDMEYEEDVHRSDTMEEKLSLAARFGVTIYYAKPGQEEYLNIVRTLAKRRGLELSDSELADEARKWELRHGGMTGRAASQLITWLEGRASEK